MKFYSKQIFPEFNSELAVAEMVDDFSMGYYILIVLDQKIIWQSHLGNASKGAADQYAADFARTNALDGVPASQWPRRMRDDVIKRFVKAHRQDDYDTMQVLAHLVAALVGWPFFVLGATRKGKSRWVNTYPDASAADMEARAQALIQCRSQFSEAHAVIGYAAHTQHFGAAQAIGRQNQTQLEALRANSRELFSGRFFD